jgi:hypothetical protein
VFRYGGFLESRCSRLLRVQGVESLGMRCSEPFGALGAEVSGRRLSKLFGAVGVEASEPRCRGPSGLLVPRLLSRRFEGWVGSRVLGALRSHGVDGCMGHTVSRVLRSPGPRGLSTCGVYVAQR